MKGPDYYDQMFKDSDTYAMDLDDAPWFDVWMEIARHITPIDYVIDLGCGVGHMSELLKGRCQKYTGYDFSDEAIRQARERGCGVFWKQDITFMDAADYEGASVVILCEVLEHLEHDFAVIEKIPKGMKVVLSVPTFMDVGHERKFQTFDHIKERYGDLLKISTHSKIYKNGAVLWHVIKATRK